MQHIGKQARLSMPDQNLDYVSLCFLAAIATEGRRKRMMGAGQDSASRDHLMPLVKHRKSCFICMVS
jgi:hypothetical protein